MLNRIRKVYQLDFAQMETPPDPSMTHSPTPSFPASDWLIGVQSEAQLSHLLESGFVYISKEEDEFENMQEDIVIPVVRENQGELLQFTGVRPPLFATEDDIRKAFEEYGIVLEVERENFDLPEDDERPDEVQELEETLTMSWKVRIYRNEKPFEEVLVESLPPFARRQLDHCHQGELEFVDGKEVCAVVSIYGQAIPLRPALTFYLNRKERHATEQNVRASVQSLLGASLESTPSGAVPLSGMAQRGSQALTLGMGDAAASSTAVPAAQAAMLESLTAGLEAQLRGMASSFPEGEREALMEELGRRGHEAVARATGVIGAT